MCERIGEKTMQAAEASAAANGAEAEMIEGLRTRIQEWRGSESKGRAMPEKLWEEAAAAAQLLGVGPVARALNLSYDTLKRRAGLADPERAATGRSDFIELPDLSAPFAGGSGDGAVVEVLATDGAKLTVRVKARNLDMSALVKAFRGRV
jgi:hypothetical protein